jgi:hypothetical protein
VILISKHTHIVLGAKSLAALFPRAPSKPKSIIVTDGACIELLVPAATGSYVVTLAASLFCLKTVPTICGEYF